MQNLEQSRHTKICIYYVKYFIAVTPVCAEVVYSCIKSVTVSYDFEQVCMLHFYLKYLNLEFQNQQPK